MQLNCTGLKNTYGPLRQVLDASKRRSPVRHQGQSNVMCNEAWLRKWSQSQDLGIYEKLLGEMKLEVQPRIDPDLIIRTRTFALVYCWDLGAVAR